MENVMSSQPATSEEYQELVASCKQTAGEEFPKLPNQVVVSEGSSEHMITSTCKKLPKRVAFSEPMSSSRSPDGKLLTKLIERIPQKHCCSVSPKKVLKAM